MNMNFVYDISSWVLVILFLLAAATGLNALIADIVEEATNQECHERVTTVDQYNISVLVCEVKDVFGEVTRITIEAETVK